MKRVTNQFLEGGLGWRIKILPAHADMSKTDCSMKRVEAPQSAVIPLVRIEAGIFMEYTMYTKQFFRTLNAFDLGRQPVFERIASGSLSQDWSMEEERELVCIAEKDIQLDRMVGCN